MYRCSDCNNPFDEPEKVIEHQFGYNLPDGGYNETYFVCPFCESSDYTEIISCCECGEDLPVENKSLYVHFNENNDFVCNDCLHDYCKEHYS